VARVRLKRERAHKIFSEGAETAHDFFFVGRHFSNTGETGCLWQSRETRVEPVETDQKLAKTRAASFNKPTTMNRPTASVCFAGSVRRRSLVNLLNYVVDNFISETESYFLVSLLKDNNLF